MENCPLRGAVAQKHSREKRFDRRALGALILVVLGIYLPLHVVFPPAISYEHDSTDYLAGAMSLAEGHGYRMCYADGTPPITFCPPLNAAYFSLVFRWFPEFPANIRWLNLWMVIAIVGCATLFFFLFRRFQIPALVASLLAGGIVLSPFWYQTAAIFYSDILFSLMVAAVVMLWLAPWPAQVNQRWLLTGVGLAAMYLTRTATLAPLVAISGLLLLGAARRRNFRSAAYFFGPVMLCVGLWNWSQAGAPHNSYQTAIRAAIQGQGGWSGYGQATLAQFQEYFLKPHFLDTVFPVLVRLPGIPAVAAAGLAPLLSGAAYVAQWSLMGAMVLGMVRAKEATHRALAVVVCAYLLQLVVYPFWVGERGLFPVIPLMLGFAWQGMRSVSMADRFKQPMIILGTGFLAVSLVCNVRFMQAAKHLLAERGHLREAVELAGWIKDHIPPAEKIAAGGDVPTLFLFTLTHRTFADEFSVLRPAHASSAPRPEERFRYVLISTNTAPMITALRASYYQSYKIVKRSAEGNLILFEVPAGR